MLGQYLHFNAYADEAVPYAQARYGRELARLYRVLDDRLRGRDFVAGSYAIADMAIYPWIHRLEREGQHLAGFPNLSRWHAAVSQRPAVARAYARARAVNTVPTINKDSKALLFGRGAERRAA